MKYHQSPKGYLPCKASSEDSCPFHSSGSVGMDAIHSHARKAQLTGDELPVLVDTAGRTRRFTFQEDGSYQFGSRHYDRHGVMLLSERTKKRDRLNQWAAYRAMTPDSKAEQFTGDLLLWEARQGVLKGKGVKVEQVQAYADAHHKGSLLAFFKSVWNGFSHEASPRRRYHLTLTTMWTSVTKWWRFFGK